MTLVKIEILWSCSRGQDRIVELCGLCCNLCAPCALLYWIISEFRK